MRTPRSRRSTLVAVVVSLVAATSGAVGVSTPAQAAFGGTPVMAWVHWAGGQTAALAVAAPDLSGKRIRYRTPSYNVTTPSVSQDGSTIAYAGWHESSRVMTRIFAIEAAGTSGPVQWTNPVYPYSDSTPVFNPDEKTLYFVRYNITRRTTVILKVTSPGGPVSAVPNTAGGTWPTVSPDGRYLAFESDTSIKVVKADGSDPFVARAGTAGAEYYTPRWSPDGRRISTVVNHGTDYTSVTTLAVHTGRTALATVHPYAATVSPASWSVGSSYLYYSALEPVGDYDKGNLYRTPVVRGTRKPLTANTIYDPWDYLPSVAGGTPPADTTKPAAPTVRVHAVGLGTMLLSAVGTSDDVSRYVVRYAAGDTAPSYTTGTLAYSGLGKTGIVLRGLTPASTYSARAFAVDWAGNISDAGPPVTATTKRHTSLTVESSSPVASYPGQVRVSATARDTASGEPLAGVELRFYRRDAGATRWTFAYERTTGADGRFEFTDEPTRNAEYQVRYVGTETQGFANSAVLPVAVAPAVSAAFVDYTVAAGEAAVLRGRVAPALATGTVVLQALTSTGWRDVRTAVLSSYQTYRFTITYSTPGRRTFRVVRSADSRYATGVSPARTLTVG